MSLLTQGIAQVTAAAKAGMSERTARKYAHSGCAPSQARASHTWRTRPDPFAEVEARCARTALFRQRRLGWS